MRYLGGWRRHRRGKVTQNRPGIKCCTFGRRRLGSDLVLISRQMTHLYAFLGYLGAITMESVLMNQIMSRKLKVFEKRKVGCKIAVIFSNYKAKVRLLFLF